MVQFPWHGIDIRGDFNVNSYDANKIMGSGNVETTHFPGTYEPKIKKVGTGQKGFLGFEKSKTVQDGHLVDDIFCEMIEEYYRAYSKFLNLLGSKKESI